jgi:hypothetical protein
MVWPDAQISQFVQAYHRVCLEAAAVCLELIRMQYHLEESRALGRVKVGAKFHTIVLPLILCPFVN